jgi:hypothetical protein
MTIHKTRGWLYWIAKMLGDVQAVTSKKKNAIPKRVGRRIAGKITGKLFREIFK